MGKRYARNMAVMVKAETTYGTDAVPTGALNAMQLNDVTFNPSVGEEVRRDLVLPYMSHQGVILTGTHATITGSFEIAGSGTPGTPPAWGPYMRACAFREVITAGSKVEYETISKLQESVTQYFNWDGVNHVLLGARGTLTGSLTSRQVARITVTLTGLLGTFSDLALPPIDLSKFIKPVPVNKANTTFELFGRTDATESFTFDVANQIEADLLINHEEIEHTDRQMTGNATIRAQALADINWFATAHGHELGVLRAVHGKQAGNIVEFDGPTIQIGRPGYANSRGILNNTLPLMFVGPNEFKVTVK